MEWCDFSNKYYITKCDIIIIAYENDNQNSSIYNFLDISRRNKLLQVTNIFGACIHKKDNRPFKEIIEDIIQNLVEYEEELAKRGTVFFGGLYTVENLYFSRLKGKKDK